MHTQSRILLTIGLLAFLACSSDDQANNDRGEQTTPTVEVTQARYGSLPLEERLSGVVRARNQTEIYPEVPGVVVEVLVSDGQFVQKDQPLVRLRDTEARERLRQAQAGLEISKAQTMQAQALLNQRRGQLARSRALSAQNMESVAEREALEALVEQAEAGLMLSQAQENQASSMLRESQTALENTIVKSPISGTIGQRNAEIGQVVNNSTRMFIIGDLSLMHIEVILNEQMLSRVRIGMTALITSTAFPDTVIVASLNRISPFLNPASYSTQGELDVPNSGRLIRPGSFVSVDILYGETEQATLIPNSALYKHPRQGVEGIFVAPTMAREITFADEPGTRTPELYGPTPIEFRPVRIIAKGREMSAIAALDSTSWVVTLGHQMLINEAKEARVRMVEWPHILNLQRMQTRDLINLIKDKSDS